MVNGLAFFSWDTRLGATLELEYPSDLKLTEDLINKIYMTHSYEEDFKKDELIEVSYKDQLILSYCDKSRVAQFGYEIVIAILAEKEKLDLYKLKIKFIKFAKELLSKPRGERKEFFRKEISIFLNQESSRKILIIGRAGTGKTTIKKIIFEGYNPKKLLSDPLEPTRGIVPSVFSWLDLKLGLFDSSGQELSDLLEGRFENDQILAFKNTDIIIYLLDYPTWISNSNLIFEDIKKVLTIIDDNKYNARLYVFFHKIDLIESISQQKFQEEVTEIIQKNFEIPIFFTSIYPNLIYNLYNAIYILLSNFSKETINIKRILDTFISDLYKTMFFITNTNDSIIVQSMSEDFNTIIINHSHKLITQLNKTFETMAENDKIQHLILSSSNFNIIMNNLNYQKFGLKNLICLSESLSANKLIWTIGQIRLELKNAYYMDKKD
jgi:hypothetical protein